MPYTYEESLQSSINYFNGDELAAKVWVDKYALRDINNILLELNPADMHLRIASEFARIEKKKFKKPLSEKEIFELLENFKYIIPQGSPMFGIGNNHQVISLSNCYLLDVPLDSYTSILEIDEQLVNISKRRGGVGIDLSNLRPKGSITHNSSRTSTGIVTWMERYSNSIREVGQAGRRGALMLTLSVHHPDILDFATVKNDSSKVTGANISIRLTKDFLDAVKDDAEYQLRFPVDSPNPTFTKLVKAKDVWNTIIHSAWLRAEPGLLMWDNVTKNTPADCYDAYKSRGTNPCQPGNAPVLTRNGIRLLQDIVIGEEIWSAEGWTKVTNKVDNGIKPVYKYKTTAGYFIGTDNHRLVECGEKKEAQYCDSIDIIAGIDSYTAINIDLQTVMDGVVFGDGSVHKASNNLVYLNIGDNDQEYFESEIKDLIKKKRDGLGQYAYEINTQIKSEEIPLTFNRMIPYRYYTGNIDIVCSFLRGLYSANGSIVNGRVTLKASSFSVIQAVQCMLSSIGIRSYYTTNKATVVEFDNGEYECKESYDLNITTDRTIFVRKIGFIQDYKNKKLKDFIDKLQTTCKPKKTTYNIISVDFICHDKVYDITVDNESHTYWTAGCNVSNCSEINLSPLDSCRLLCLNLYSYVKNPFKKGEFDFELFQQHAMIAQRLMDDLVDLESEKIKAIIQKVETDPEPEDVKQRELRMWKRILKFNDEGRRTGTGITALADCLAALGLRYGSQKCKEFVDTVFTQLKHACYSSSVEMAKELGSFACYESRKEKDCPYIKQIAMENPLLYADMVQYGRRNICLTTVAPTGTVSIMTQTTSGIEPLFMIGYKRRKKINHEDKNSRVDFTDPNGDSWQEFTVYHPKVKEWMDITGETDITKSPWFGCCANDINWEDRVDLQSIMQQHICHAISSTVNLPETVSELDVAKIYEKAFSSNCKGITVYRDNCRTGVLVSNVAQVDDIKKNHAPKRPRQLKCNIHHTVVKGVAYYVAVGILNNDPYEVFVGRNTNSDGDSIVPKSRKSGFIYKKKQGEYIILDLEENPLTTIYSNQCEEHEEALARMTSVALRHGADVHFVTESLLKTRGEMNSFAKSIARSLKEYIKDGTASKEKCPECGNTELKYQEGCKTCSCGFSKCS